MNNSDLVIGNIAVSIATDYFRNIEWHFLFKVWSRTSQPPSYMNLTRVQSFKKRNWIVKVYVIRSRANEPVIVVSRVGLDNQTVAYGQALKLIGSLKAKYVDFGHSKHALEYVLCKGDVMVVPYTYIYIHVIGVRPIQKELFHSFSSPFWL